jgi:FdrA protein
VEALAVLEDRIGPVRSNVHPDPGRHISPGDDPEGGPTLLDLGDDELTAGRPHPMIDPAPVAERLAAARGGVVLLDVVLGHGAHPDPASVLVPALAETGAAPVVALVGTAGDPQGLGRQASALTAAGAVVHRSLARAAGVAAGLLVQDRAEAG